MANDVIHEDVAGPCIAVVVAVVAVAVIVNGGNLNEGEFGVVDCCGRHVLDLAIKVTLVDDVVDVLDERAEDADKDVAGIPVGGDVVHVACGLTASADLAVDITALQLEDDGDAGGGCAVKDEGDHPAIYNPPINANIVVFLDVINRRVVDFIFGVRDVRGVATQDRSEFRIDRKGGRVCERLKDLGKEDVLITEELEGSFVKGELVLEEDVEPEIVAEGPGP